MRGYTDETAHTTGFEPDFIAELARAVAVPVIAEGRIATPAEARAAIESGAWAVIVGTAITRPAAIAREFAAAIETARRAPHGDILGIDLGGTNTKFGVVTADGRLARRGLRPTPAGGGAVLLAHLKSRRGTTRRSARAAGLAASRAGHRHRRLGRSAYRPRGLRHRKPARLDGHPHRRGAPGRGWLCPSRSKMTPTPWLRPKATSAPRADAATSSASRWAPASAAAATSAAASTAARISSPTRWDTFPWCSTDCLAPAA